MAFGKTPYGYNPQPVSPYFSPQMAQGGYSYGQPTYGAYSPNSAPQTPIQPPMGSAQPTQTQPAKTNMVFVTSLEDALQKTNMPNCNLLYLHQDKPLIFNIVSDEFGRKTYTTYELVEYKEQKAEEQPEEPQKDYVTKKEFADYQKQVVNSINRLKALIVNDTAPTPTISMEVEPKPVVAKEKGGEENG